VVIWYDRATGAYWGRVDRLAKYLLESLKQVQVQNPFVGIACIVFYFVAGMFIVTPLCMAIGPIVQVLILIAAVAWTCLAKALGWHRPSIPQLVERYVEDERAPKATENGERSFAA
jgi:hypothetical protein